MAYHFCPSPSSLLHERQPLCSSLCSLHKFKVRNFAFSYKLPQSKTFLHVNHVSLQEPISQTEDVNSAEDANLQDPGGKSTASSKFCIWVNPRSPRAKLLQKKSYDARFRA